MIFNSRNYHSDPKKNRRDCLLRVPHRIGDTFARRLKCVANFQTTSNFSLWSFCARSVVLRHIEQPFPRRSLLHYGLPKCPSWISSLTSTFAPTVLSLGRRAIGLSLVTLFEIKKNIVVLVCSGQNPRCSTFVRTPRIISHRCSVRFTGSVGWKPSIPKPVKNVKILATCRSISFFFHCRKHLLHISQFVMLPRFVVQLLRLVADLLVIALLLPLSLQPLRRGRNITCLFKNLCASHPQGRLGDFVQNASSSCATGDAPVHDRQVAFFKWLPLLLLTFFAQALFPFIHMLIRTGVHPHVLAVCCRETRTTPTSGPASSCRRRVSIFLAPPSRRRLGSRISLSTIRVFPVP